jgi:AcrR family transcriptional regulator
MSKRKTMTPQGIVDAAIELLDQQGDEQFSMRKLATHLGVDPMAIYYHIPNRAALMSCVFDTVVGKCELPQNATSWQQEVKGICAGFRKLASGRNNNLPRVPRLGPEWTPVIRVNACRDCGRWVRKTNHSKGRKFDDCLYR